MVVKKDKLDIIFQFAASKHRKIMNIQARLYSASVTSPINTETLGAVAKIVFLLFFCYRFGAFVLKYIKETHLPP